MLFLCAYGLFFTRGIIMKKTSLAKKMLIAMCLGLIAGVAFLFLRESMISGGNQATWDVINNWLFADITAAGNEKAVGIIYIVGQIFVRLLQVVIVPMVFCSITLAIARMDDAKKLGRIAGKTMGCFLLESALALTLAGLVGYFLYSKGVFSGVNIENLGATSGSTGANPLKVLLDAFPVNITAAFSSNGSILAVVVCAVGSGLAMGKLSGKVETVKRFMEELSEIVQVVLSFIVNYMAPVGVFALLWRTFAAYGIDYLVPAVAYVVTTVILLLVFLIFGYAIIIAIFGRINPIPFVKKIAKVAIFGFSTSSSAATLGLNQKTTVEELGASNEISSFVLPLGMTVNMNGTAIMQVIAAIFIAAVGGYELTLGSIFTIAILALVASIGTPAAPGAGAVILFTVLTGMGFGNDAALMAYSLILAINRPIEMLVTSLNVVGDSASALIVSKSENALDMDTYNSQAK